MPTLSIGQSPPWVRTFKKTGRACKALTPGAALLHARAVCQAKEIRALFEWVDPSQASWGSHSCIFMHICESGGCSGCTYACRVRRGPFFARSMGRPSAEVFFCRLRPLKPPNSLSVVVVRLSESP